MESGGAIVAMVEGDTVSVFPDGMERVQLPVTPACTVIAALTDGHEFKVSVFWNIVGALMLNVRLFVTCV
jgi:hypothetical protein